MKWLLPVACAALALLVLAGCSKKLSRLIVPNRAPSVEIHQDLSVASGVSQYHATWKGTDPEGRLDHYVYAVDPPSVDRVDETWVNTRATVWTKSVAASRPESGDPSARPARQPTILAVRAVDAQGLMSDPAAVGFFEDNIPPVVMITSPRPSALLIPTLGQAVTIQWQGVDPDGQSTTQPVKYKYILLSDSSEFPISLARLDPDSLRRYYAPTFAGWDSTSRDTTMARYEGLTPGQNYLFVVVAFDEAGDYSPVFSFNSNMLNFMALYSKVIGPKITVFNETFQHIYAGYNSDLAYAPNLTEFAGQPLTFNWFAEPIYGSDITGYRWTLDPVDIFDQTPRSGPNDLGHWSELSLVTTSATLGPFTAAVKGTQHVLYVEARDNVGLRSLAIVRFLVVAAPTFARPLLIVDDTRLLPDEWLGGNLLPPHGPWPTAAELDTFLYARGGYPWQGYPSGTMSTPGLFDGYSFDTLGTRGLPGATVPLHTLQNYQNVIWYVDLASAASASPTDPLRPITALRQMCSPGQLNNLATYAAAGGRVWLAGGGAAYASLIPWNDRANDQPATVFSINDPKSELGPGRFMYDAAAWRSEIWSFSTSGGISRFTGRLPSGAYTTAPDALQPKTAATDPLPPLRTSTDFYRPYFDLEFLRLPDEIVEGGASTLDTLYQAAGSGLPIPSQNPHNVAMTYYHGPSHPPFVFSGFNFWYFRRSQCQALVDFVLQDLWGLSRSAAPRARLVPAPARVDQSVRPGAASARGAAGRMRAARGRGSQPD